MRLQAKPLHCLPRNFFLPDDFACSWMKTTWFIVVEARMHNTPISKTAKFPILLPPKHIFTSLNIQSVQLQLLHSGTNATFTAIWQRFWIPSGRQQIKSLLRQYVNVICGKHCGKLYPTPDPSPLPEIRTHKCEPFAITGSDFTKTMHVRDSNTKAKIYVSLFTCATIYQGNSPQDHDSSEHGDILLAFRRFASHRSLPEILVSDNVSTYTVAAEELIKLLQSDHPAELLGKQGVQ